MLKRLASLLLLVAMLANAMAPLLERLGGKEACELTELGAEKGEKEGKTAKELEKEALGIFHDNHFEQCAAMAADPSRERMPAVDDRADSELFARSPEQPPEA